MPRLRKPTRSKPAALGVGFYEPSPLYAQVWVAPDATANRLLEEAVSPTLRAWAAYGAGLGPDPTSIQPLLVIQATFAGFRRWLLEWEADSLLPPHHAHRPKLLTPELVAYAWCERLTDNERAALVHLIRTGEPDHEARAWYDQQHSNTPTLFAS